MILLACILATSPLPTADYLAAAPNCYDGDTCRFDLLMPQGLRHSQRVRLVGIDAPELRAKLPAARVAALKARDDLRAWLADAKAIVVRVQLNPRCPDTDGCEARDKYGRLLGVVVADGQDLNERQVQVGNARRYP